MVVQKVKKIKTNVTELPDNMLKQARQKKQAAGELANSTSFENWPLCFVWVTAQHNIFENRCKRNKMKKKIK